MKTFARLFILLFLGATLFSSCQNKEKCAAYSKVPVEAEQAQ